MIRHFRNFITFTNRFGIHGKLQMAILVFGGFIASLLELLGLSAIFPLLNMILQPNYFEESSFVRKLSSITGVTSHSEITMLIGFIVAMLFVGKNLFQVLFLKYEFLVLTKWHIHIVSRLYHIYMNADYEIFMGRNSSRMINLITHTVPAVIKNYIHKFLSLLNYAMTGIVILAYIIYVNWLIALMIMITGLIVIKGYSFLSRVMTRSLGGRVLKLNQSQQNLLQQSFAGYKETRTHLKEVFFAKRFLGNSQELAKTEGKLFFLEQLPPAIVEIAIMVMLIAIFEVVILSDSSMFAAVAQVGVIVLSSMRMIPVINRSIAAIVLINSSAISLEELLEETKLFKVEDHVFDRKVFLDEEAEQSIVPLKYTDKMALEHISYTYPEATKPALNDVSFSIAPGEFIGITGPSGSGKSTLINILLGFLVKFEGRFAIDDVAINRDNIKNLRKIIGFVDQNIFIMDTSIAENVAYGIDKDHIDMARVEQALRKAQLWDFVSALPEGVLNAVGENGKLLSGGQRQRIAIARAFYRDLKILILDEASASLDVETEHKFFEFLKTLKGELAVIMIAHRLSTLKDCERIIFMDNTKIADQGTFEELYHANEKFRSYIEYSKIHSPEAIADNVLL